mgnify:CR=1 FL=1
MLRNYPILGHFRWFAEDIRPELQQCFVERDTDGEPVMTDSWVTVAAYGTPAEARLAANFLEAEGIPTFLSGENAVGSLWYLGTALGGVELQVASHDFERASEVLEVHRAQVSGKDKPAEKEPLDETGEDSSQDESSGDAASSAADEIADRVFRSAMFGVFFFPLSFYSYFLWTTLSPANGPLSTTGRSRLTLGLILDFVVVAFWSAVMIFFRYTKM